MAAAATVGAAAGCGEVEDAVGSSGNGNGNGGQDRAQGDILDLLHAPSAIESTDHYSFSWSSPATIDALQDEIDDEVFRRLVTRATSGTRGNLIDAIGVDFWDVGTYYNAGPVSALIGDFDRGDVWRRLQYEGLQYQGNYNGFALIEPEEGNGNVTLALEGEGRIDDEDAPSEISRIYAGESNQSSGSTSVVQTIIDVADGTEDRYGDEVDAVNALVDGLHDGVLMNGETFDAVDLESAPDADVEHEAIAVGQEQSGRLTEDSTTNVFGSEFQYMDRYGFAGAAETEVTITVTPESPDWPVAVLLFADNSDQQIQQETGMGEFEVSATLPQDGGYNFIIFDEEQFQSPRGIDRNYTVEVTIEGSAGGGPEAGVFEGETARGDSLRFGDDEAIRQWVLVFENEPPMDEIEIWVSENDGDGRLFGPYEEVTHERDGSRAIIEGTIPTSDVDVEIL